MSDGLRESFNANSSTWTVRVWSERREGEEGGRGEEGREEEGRGGKERGERRLRKVGGEEIHVPV